MNTLLTIKNDVIGIDSLSVRSLAVTGESMIESVTATTITTDTLHVKNLITDNALEMPTTEWIANTDDDLNGRGLKWEHNTGKTQLIYRSGGRIWNSNSFDIPSNASYMIDEIPVITANSLGSSISKSNLKQVGQLNFLEVIGDTALSGFAFFNSVNNRLGLGTSEPTASISILDNNVEISIGSPVYNIANIGTRSNHDVAIISDNLPRLVVKNNGEVHIGNELSKAGVLRVFGSLYADNIVSDTRLERNTSLEFAATAETTSYGKGLRWTGTGKSKQFILHDLPDRFWSSESIDIANGNSYYINNNIVLSETALGNSILESKLTTVGKLISLEVVGGIYSDSVVSSVIRAKTIIADDNLSITTNDIAASDRLSLSLNQLELLTFNSDEIVLGNKVVANTPIKLFGPVAIGINNPDPLVSLSVNGNVSFNNKKFVTGIAIPATGNFNKGDICWNQNPTEIGYVGWICVNAGNPGSWKPFGLIGA